MTMTMAAAAAAPPAAAAAISAAAAATSSSAAATSALFDAAQHLWHGSQCQCQAAVAVTAAPAAATSARLDLVFWQFGGWHVKVADGRGEYEHRARAGGCKRKTRRSQQRQVIVYRRERQHEQPLTPLAANRVAAEVISSCALDKPRSQFSAVNAGGNSLRANGNAEPVRCAKMTA